LCTFTCKKSFFQPPKKSKRPNLLTRLSTQIWLIGKTDANLLASYAIYQSKDKEIRFFALFSKVIGINHACVCPPSMGIKEVVAEDMRWPAAEDIRQMTAERTPVVEVAAG
jgi:hypothetical protein